MPVKLRTAAELALMVLDAISACGKLESSVLSLATWLTSCWVFLHKTR